MLAFNFITQIAMLHDNPALQTRSTITNKIKEKGKEAINMNAYLRLDTQKISKKFNFINKTRSAVGILNLYFGSDNHLLVFIFFRFRRNGFPMRPVLPPFLLG